MDIVIPALIFAGIILLAKPVLFSWLLRKSGEIKKVSWEIGVRLGQMSEFSLLIIYMALQTGLVTSHTAYMVEAAIIMTFIVSCYWTVMRYPTPLAATDRLRRD
jgi:predicted Kef-type K+ transport protein